jgi:hypothetical protein
MVALMFRCAYRSDHHQVQRGAGARYSRADAQRPVPADPGQLARGRDHSNGVQLALGPGLPNSLRMHRLRGVGGTRGA